MSNRAHATEIRMMLCPQCGAPVTGPAGGGQFQCGYCRTVGTIAARDDRSAGRASPLSPEQENARIQRLWLQLQQAESPQGNAGDPYDLNMVITDVAHLLQTPPAEFAAAWQQAWNGAVAMLHQDPSAVQQRRVFWLAQILGSSINPERGRDDAEWERRRAVIETALDLLPDPGHRQILRGNLFGRALRSGDVAAAERWLAGCDPAPGYLSLDSDYRTSVAMLEIVRRNWGGVIAVLGWRPTDLPWAKPLAARAGLYRAHALEEMGYAPQALEQYLLAVQQLGPHAGAMLRAADWMGLCHKLRARAPRV